MPVTVVAPPAPSLRPSTTTAHGLARRQLSDAVVGPHWLAGVAVAVLVLIARAVGKNAP